MKGVKALRMFWLQISDLIDSYLVTPVHNFWIDFRDDRVIRFAVYAVILNFIAVVLRIAKYFR